jgi:hypothetical protein
MSSSSIQQNSLKQKENKGNLGLVTGIHYLKKNAFFIIINKTQ